MRVTILRLLPFLFIGLTACKSNESEKAAAAQETSAPSPQTTLPNGWYAITEDTLNAVKLPLYKKKKESYFLEKTALLNTDHVQETRIHFPKPQPNGEQLEPPTLVMKLDSQGSILWKEAAQSHPNGKIGLVISGRLIQVQVVTEALGSGNAIVRRKEITESELRTLKQAIGK